MSVIKWRIGVMVVIVAVVIAAACGGSEETSGEPTAVPPTEAPASTATSKPTDPPPTSEEQPTTSEEQPTPSQEEQEAVATEPPVEPEPAEESEIPYDVPLMEGATELFIQRETGSVTYVLEEMDIENVVEFYKDTMTEQGWETKTSSEIGLMATLVFETEQARTSVSLQANNIARTVTVRLFIFEK